MENNTPAQLKQDLKAIADLLKPHLQQDDRILAHKTQMAETETFITSVTLEWIAARVGFASQLPLFQPHLDPTGNVERDTETVDDILQRPLDWSRQATLTQYLTNHKDHKFPAVLVVLSPAWVDNPQASQWDKQGQATQSAIEFLPLDSQGKLGLLQMSGDISVFALDGQHRLMGIQGLMQLLRTGRLQPYSKQKKPVGDAITVKEMTQKFGITPQQLQQLSQETIGVEFIPAVVKGETRAQARQRVRSIFVHVNLMAVKLSKGQLALLDEDDGFSIVTRQVVVSHPLFVDKPGRHPRINWDSATVASKSTVLTTLQAVTDMGQRYLTPKFPHWKAAKPGLVPRRPTTQELETGIQELQQLFDALASLPSYQRLEDSWETPDLRRFSFEKPPGEGNILFRPVGQVAVAAALGVLVFYQQQPLTEIFQKLQNFDGSGGFSGMEYPDSLWYGILYDPNKRRVRVAGKDLAAKLLIYLLGGMQQPMECAELRKALADARTFENKAVSFDGKFVKPKEVGLPEIL
jgi:DGQHR domain-containing protein